MDCRIWPAEVPGPPSTPLMMTGSLLAGFLLTPDERDKRPFLDKFIYCHLNKIHINSHCGSD